MRPVSDVRERRAEHARKARRRGIPETAGRYAMIAGVVILIAVGVGWAATHQPPGKRFIHEHASWSIFIDDEHVSFVGSNYDVSTRGMGPPHMHVGDGREVWHIEGQFSNGTSDLTLEKMFTYTSVLFHQGYMKLDSPGHNGTEWRDAGNATWKVYVSKMAADQRGPFDLIPGDYSQYVPQNQDKVLVTYGSLTPDALAREEAAVPAPP